jgi:AraC-like DNA-binding protein
MRLGFIEIAAIVIFFQFTAIIPFLVSISKRSLSNKLLTLFLTAKALCITNFLAYRLFDFFYQSFPHIFFIGSSFTLLWGPLLFFYVRSILIPRFKLKKTSFLHFIPFAIHFVALLTLFHWNDADTKREIVNNTELPIWLTGRVYMYFLHVSILTYLIFILKDIFLWRRRVAPDSEYKINVRWLYFVISGFTIKWGVDVWQFFIVSPPLAETLLIISRLILFLFVNLLIFKVLKFPDILSVSTGISIKPKNYSLSENTFKSYSEKLNRYMHEEKPYLDPDLNLLALSAKLDIPQRSLSEVIHVRFQQNFYDYINSFRIKEAQDLLKDSNQTVLEVLYNVGFNSKSSFNTAFKKITGLTPSVYRKTA